MVNNLHMERTNTKATINIALQFNHLYWYLGSATLQVPRSLGCYLNCKGLVLIPGLFMLRTAGPGLEPGPLAFRANALTNRAIQDKYESMIELIS